MIIYPRCIIIKAVPEFLRPCCAHFMRRSVPCRDSLKSRIIRISLCVFFIAGASSGSFLSPLFLGRVIFSPFSPWTEFFLPLIIIPAVFFSGRLIWGFALSSLLIFASAFGFSAYMGLWLNDASFTVALTVWLFCAFFSFILGCRSFRSSWTLLSAFLRRLRRKFVRHHYERGVPLCRRSIL